MTLLKVRYIKDENVDSDGQDNILEDRFELSSFN